MTKRSRFKYFKTSPEVIRLAVMLYLHFPLSLRNVEDLPHERGIYVSNETIRVWWRGSIVSRGHAPLISHLRGVAAG